MRHRADLVSNKRLTRLVRAQNATLAHTSEPSLAADLKELLKPGISLFVAATAGAGYLFGAHAGIDALTLLGLIVGVGLTAGGSGALNHFLEHRFDAKMQRTSDRPIPSGRVSASFVLAYGLTAIILGVATLAVLTNTLTVVLAVLCSLSYVIVYTPFKRISSWNTLIGTIPGALPSLGGYAAATGTLGSAGWAIFAILVLWQLPHFFSLAWMYRDDYKRGGFVMLPTTHPDGILTARIALGSSLLLLIAGIIPAVIGTAGWLYFAGMLILGTWFTIPAFAFASEPTDLRARRLLIASIIYVPVFFVLVVMDYILL